MPSKEERIKNLKKANEQSHRVIVDPLREAMCELFETKDVYLKSTITNPMLNGCIAAKNELQENEKTNLLV